MKCLIQAVPPITDLAHFRFAPRLVLEQIRGRHQRLGLAKFQVHRRLAKFFDLELAGERKARQISANLFRGDGCHARIVSGHILVLRYCIDWGRMIGTRLCRVQRAALRCTSRGSAKVVEQLLMLRDDSRGLLGFDVRGVVAELERTAEQQDIRAGKHVQQTLPAADRHVVHICIGW